MSGRRRTPDPTPLLRPRSVAVVGASERAGSYGDNVLRNLAAAGFEGDVWGINPKRDEVHGRPCVPSVGDLPEPVDAVVVAIPAAGVAAVLAEAIERGCGGAIVLSAGFGEIEAGRRAGAGADRDRARRRPAGLRAELQRDRLGRGRGRRSGATRSSGSRTAAVALITQSGNIAVNALGMRRGIGFHTVVSTGNQAVLDAGDWIEAVAALDGVRSIALFLEEDGDGARSRPGAGRLRRARDRGRGAQGRRPRRRARAPRAPTPAPSPATSASSPPCSRRPAPRPPATRRSCWSWRGAWRRRRGAARPTAASPSSPARAGTRGSPPTSPSARASRCPSWRRRPARRLAELLPDGGDRRQSRSTTPRCSGTSPRRSSRSPRRSARTRGSASCCCSSTSRTGSPPPPEPAGTRCAGALVAGRRARRRRAPPRLDRPRPAARAQRARARRARHRGRWPA